MRTEFNHAANTSPRSGSSKRTTPVVWSIVLTAVVVTAIWFTIAA